MKKTLLSFLFLLPIAAMAQEFYGGLNPGYGWPALKQTLLDDRIRNVDGTGSGTESHSTHPMSLGSGFTPGFYAGYMVNDNIGLELGVSYLMGKATHFHSEKTDHSSDTYGASDDRFSATMLRLTPGLRIQFGEGKLKPYMTASFVLGMAARAVEEYSDYNYSPMGNSTTYKKEEYTKGLSYGAKAVVGLNYEFGPKLSLFLAANGIYHNWAMKYGKLLKYEVDGVDQMPSQTTNDIHTEFVDSYTEGMVTDPNTPNKSLKYYLPLSSVGIELGLHLKFGKKE